MVKGKWKTPWLWIPSLSAAVEIPTAVVTFVSLLMFLQFGLSDTWASLLCALLFLPSILKPRLRPLLLKAGNFKRNIHLSEAFLFCILIAIALYINYFPVNPFLLFALLLLVSFLCSVHEQLAQLYYDRMLPNLQQRLYDKTRIFASQTTVILTYGILIISVGFLEIFFRSVRKAWAMESYLVAGAFLLFALMNLLVMQPPRGYRHPKALKTSEKASASQNISTRLSVLLPFALLMLPQALMFNTRVFFLLADPAEGGLGCSVQDVGFAQGTIGVIAFSVGLLLGRLLRAYYGETRTFWWLAIPLTISPLFYMLMSQFPPIDQLTLICCMTFLAQFCFGFGLNLCNPFAKSIFGEGSLTNIKPRTPLVALVMLLPMALSGWLETLIGFKAFFLLDICLAPLIWFIVHRKFSNIASTSQT